MSVSSSSLMNALTKTNDFIKANLGTIGAGVGGAAIGGAVGYAAGRSSRSSAKKRRKKSSRYTRKKRYTKARYKRSRGRRYTPHTAGKRKDTSHRRIRYTKHGQPYVIMGNGRARFIKKKGARSSHRRSGGRY